MPGPDIFSLPGAAIRDAFGEPLTITHGAETRAITGSYSVRHLEALAADMSSTIYIHEHRVLVSASDLAGLPRSGYTVERANGEVYAVRSALPDGYGSVRLILNPA